MEVYFGQRSFDPGMQRQGTIQWIVHAGLVRAAPPRVAIDEAWHSNESRGDIPLD